MPHRNTEKEESFVCNSVQICPEEFYFGIE